MILLLATKTRLLFALRAMFYSKCENGHKHITKCSRLMKKMPGKTIWQSAVQFALDSSMLTKVHSNPNP